ncbi:TadE/TadG family type IV pilus assembly protein [Nocardia sp. NPDC051030]|uniref:TadE/TadG family type IV pilus assembly protein n=1 Tax=Nocardia sp. NPDC051030 TaxID=3155162 RepID=UPI003447681E
MSTIKYRQGGVISAAQRQFSRAARWMRRTADRGDAVLQTVILTPAILLLLGVIIVGGTVALAHQKVQHAAMEGARAASIARPAIYASQPAARTAVERDMIAKGLVCTSTDVSIDTTSLGFDPGIPAFVRVTVRCDIELSVLGIPLIGGHRTITASAISPADTYRERVR